jgi:hypothetical protein
LLAAGWVATTTSIGQGDDLLVGVWDNDQGFRTSQLLFRPNGRYQLDTQSTDPDIDLSSTERGHYRIEGAALTLTPYDYVGRPEPRRFDFQQNADSISLTSADFGQTQLVRFRAGSKADVLAREAVHSGLVGIWRRHVAFLGDVECTLRPGGYYVVKQTPDDPQFATSYSRGRYEQVGNQLTFKPYSDAQEIDELDFFGNELTFITTDNFSSTSATYQAVPGSGADVQAKAAVADAFLARPNWQTGVWEIRNGNQAVDLTLRPDGRYISELGSGASKQTVRGRYTLDSQRIRLIPFAGQDLYSRSGGDFGNAERIRQLDYYDGELQFIDLEAIAQSVTVARKRLGSDESVAEKVRQAQAERARADWQVGIWEVNDPAGWMEFTFRPDHVYIAKAGAGGVPREVERGRYRLGPAKLTMAPYPNLGQPRGFELDLYDGAWLLIGAPYRMLVARKVPGSENGVTQATTDPDALKGARGPLAGLWTLDLNGYSAELIFRPDGQFRLVRCVQGKAEQEFGLYSVDLPSRTLVLDSRVAEVATAGFDFYSSTMTLVSTNQGFPVTYRINPGQTDTALQASLAADVEEAKLDALWLTRVPLGPRNPDAGEVPTLPLDLLPGHVFEAATVFAGHHHYQRLIPSFVNFGSNSVPVVNAQEWHFVRNGRALIRFTQYVAGVGYPFVVPEIVQVWGAYRIEPKPAQQDILHIYADNLVRIETDAGEQLEMTLENGRRHLVWGKDRAVLDEWAAEDKPVTCQLPAAVDPNLFDTGLSLETTVAPDDLIEGGPIQIRLSRAVDGSLTIRGTNSSSATLVTEHAMSLTPPIVWQGLQTNAFPVGPFTFSIPAATGVQGYYRLR